MPETDRAVVTEALGAAGGSSRSRNVATKRGSGRLTQSATRKPTATITVCTADQPAISDVLTCPTHRRKDSRRKLRLVAQYATSRAGNASRAPPRPPAMSVPLKIVRRLYLSMRDSCHNHVDGVDTGAACWDCAKTGHTCRPVRGIRAP